MSQGRGRFKKGKVARALVERAGKSTVLLKPNDTTLSMMALSLVVDNKLSNIKDFVENGTLRDIHFSTKSSIDQLYSALDFCKDPEILKFLFAKFPTLIDAFTTINPDNKASPFKIAFLAKSVEICEVLLDQFGKDFIENYRTEDGENILHLAASNFFDPRAFFIFCGKFPALALTPDGHEGVGGGVGSAAGGGAGFAVGGGAGSSAGGGEGSAAGRGLESEEVSSSAAAPRFTPCSKVFRNIIFYREELKDNKENLKKTLRLFLENPGGFIFTDKDERFAGNIFHRMIDFIESEIFKSNLLKNLDKLKIYKARVSSLIKDLIKSDLNDSICDAGDLYNPDGKSPLALLVKKLGDIPKDSVPGSMEDVKKSIISVMITSICLEDISVLIRDQTKSFLEESRVNVFKGVSPLIDLTKEKNKTMIVDLCLEADANGLCKLRNAIKDFYDEKKAPEDEEIKTESFIGESFALEGVSSFSDGARRTMKPQALVKLRPEASRKVSEDRKKSGDEFQFFTPKELRSMGLFH